MNLRRPGQGGEQAALAGTVGPHQAVHLAGANAHRESPQQGQWPSADVEAVDHQSGAGEPFLCEFGYHILADGTAGCEAPREEARHDRDREQGEGERAC